MQVARRRLEGGASWSWSWAGWSGICWLLLAAVAAAEEPAAAGAEPPREELYKKFAESMSGVKLVGQFTVIGKNIPPAKEEYTILSATKGEKGDSWILLARIKYGQHDVTVPLPLTIKWAGTTPVITLDNLTIPGLGTFNARVLFHEKSYAGTWSHDKVGGQLFGTVEKLTAEERAAAEASGDKKP
ncbi:MAG: hypothetical protein U0935_05105 [Pirellulales bacterium]